MTRPSKEGSLDDEYNATPDGLAFFYFLFFILIGSYYEIFIELV